ncbi:hypothetical protein N9C06_01105 [Salibacteraceae bacterium]|nr:hypothetical protein [Salibacteraceae bacterium]
MANALIRAFQFLVYSNLYLGLVLGGFSFHGFGSCTEYRIEYSLLIASSSIAVYTFHALFGLRYIQEEIRSDRHKWLNKNRSVLWATTAFLGLLSLLQLTSIPNIIPLLLPALGLTAFYVLPIFGKRLRDLNYAKVFLVSAVVCYLCRFIPQYINGQTSWDLFFLFELLLCFAFLFLLTMPFDLRDQNIERRLKTKTHINKTDSKQAFKFVFVGLGVCILGLLLLSRSHPETFSWRLFEIAALVFAFLAIFVPERNQKELFYPLFFEGPLLLMGLFSIYLSI